MSFFNQYSFLMLIVLAGISLSVGLWRWRAAHPYLRTGLMAWYVLGALLLALATRYPPGTDAPQTPQQVEAMLNEGRPTLVMLYSNYCMGCVMSLPAVRSLSEELRAMSDLQWRVLLLDVHAQPASVMLERFAFRTTPTYILFDGQSRELWRANGVPSAQTLMDLVRA